ncbi:MAG: hypothetical protein AAFO91_17080, partial [Bacteroidota bacterium]
MTKLFDATSKFINRMRWKAFFFDRHDKDQTLQPEDDSEYNIFRSNKSGPESDKLLPFESDLWHLVKSIRFKKVKSAFQVKLNTDLRKITSSDRVTVFSDKTANMYSMDSTQYRKLLEENVTRDYRLAENNTVDQIDTEAMSIIQRNCIKGKIPRFQLSDAYVTIKDHKANFPQTIKCRLINPSKTHIAKVSKTIIERVVKDVRANSNLLQWKNSVEVISWFKETSGRNKCFVTFDIVDFYPSITYKHLLDAIEFAKCSSPISESDMEIIEHSCKSVLWLDGRAWRKKQSSDLFDVPMGSFHGAEICDLIGLHLLSKLAPLFKEGCYGLYRDDGLAIIERSTPQALDNIRKECIATMKE